MDVSTGTLTTIVFVFFLILLLWRAAFLEIPIQFVKPQLFLKKNNVLSAVFAV